MSLKGKWRIVEMLAWDKDFLDLVEPAFDWGGADEMGETHGDGWAKFQDDGSLVGEITFHNGDESGFIARRWEPSSTAC